MSDGDGDELHTWVHSVRWEWVPTATSHRGRCLRTTPHEVWNELCLSVTGSHQVCGGPGPLPGSLGKADYWGRSSPPTLNCKVEGWWRATLPRLVLFMLMGPPLQPVEIELFSDTRYMILQLYVTEGSRSYTRVLSRNRRATIYYRHNCCRWPNNKGQLRLLRPRKICCSDKLENGFGSCSYSVINLTPSHRPIEIWWLRSNEYYSTMNLLQ
jgi:hypothetical protein